MNFSKFQKFTSSALLFFLFFSFTIRVPFLWFFYWEADAGSETYYNLVSIIVEESKYNAIKSELERYASDVQSTLENTRVVILPAPENADPFNIASLNESLYFEWYNSLASSDFESRLVWTLLVGDLPIPYVFHGSASSKTIIPYTDFIDKSYVYNHESLNYEKNENADDDFSAEIWHWVINPQSWDAREDIELIKDYFDKNHDFYSWDWVFNIAKWILNENLDDEIPEDYQPYVFYYDQFRETSSLQYQKYEWYKAYLENREDLSYNRYSKELATAIKDQVLSGSSEDMRDLIADLDPNFPLEDIWDGPDVSNAPDIQTRHVTDASTKKFLEIFNSSALWEMRKLVFNAGRYNEWWREVNVDMIPFLISALDEVNDQITKNVSQDIESQIDDIIENGLSRNIAIPVSIETSGSRWCTQTHTNFLYGMQASEIQNASECSIYRGSTESGGTLVEANRWLNINNSQKDIEKNQELRRLQQSAGFKTADLCNWADTQGYWGWNSPLNLDTSSGDFALWARNVFGAIEPLFDIEWAKQVTDSSKIATPLNCFQNNYITTYSESPEFDGFDFSCETDLSVPINWNPVVEWSCDSTNQRYNFSDSFDSLYLWARPNICDGKRLVLDGTGVSCAGSTSGWATHSYKKISSYIKHVSPTADEYAAQLNNQVSPSLPIDKDRYVDFISADGSYQKINYPNLFALDDDTAENPEKAQQNLKAELDRVSLQINTIRNNNNPNALSWNQRSLYELLKTWDFPSRDIDLYADFQARDLSVYSLKWDSKDISYTDTLSFALYWNSLNTPSAKYKFIFENYLSDQFTTEEEYNLPKNKKSYEIAYLGAPGDAQNMYIKLDPESKSDNEYASTISDNIKLDSNLLTSNIGNNFTLNLWDIPSGDLEKKTRFWESAFQCAPPDGVPIWEWIPAVTCWMNDMLPPTIWISEGHCGTSLLTEEEEEEYNTCNGDVNKNGVSDCIEWKLADWNLALSADADWYGYNSWWNLSVEIQDSAGAKVRLDNASYVEFELAKVEIPLDTTREFDNSNIQIIYDDSIPELATEEARELARDYVSFKESRLRVRAGSTRSYFSTKGQDANIFFRTSLSTADHTWQEIIALESSLTEIQVRWDMLFTSTFKLSEDEEGFQTWESSLLAHDATNVYIIDWNQVEKDEVSSEIQADSVSDEKLIFSIENVSRAGNTLPIAYPLDIKIVQDDELVFQQLDVSQQSLSDYIWLTAFESAGAYELLITDAEWMTSKKEFDVLPNLATSLDVDISTSVAEVWWAITTNLFTIYDDYNNPTTGSLYRVEANIFGNGLEFSPSGQKDIEIDTFEWYSAFRLKTTQSAWVNKVTFDLFDADNNKVTTITETIRVLDGIQLDINPLSENIEVWGWVYDFDLSLKDASNTIISDFNTRAYLILNPLYGNPIKSYVNIEKWKWRISLQTSTLAGKDIKLEFQIEWWNEIYKKYIDILPGKPLKVDLALSKWKMEANPDEFSLLEASLKDRYDNLVYNDNTTEFTSELLEKYADIVSFDAIEKTALWWKATFKISWTETPGIARFKISTSPDIWENSFTIAWSSPFPKFRLDDILSMRKDGILTSDGRKIFREYSDSQYISQFPLREDLLDNETYKSLSETDRVSVLALWDASDQLVVNWVWANAGSIETFYFWNKDGVFGNNYNALHSVLLWAPYWDVTEENYLAWSLLFDRKNKSLSVTSLLNDPYERDDIISLHPNGSLSSLSSGADITQDIEFYFDIGRDGKLMADISNQALSTYVWKLYYNLSDNIEVSLCEWNPRSCLEDNQWTQILGILSDQNYIFQESRWWIILKNAFGREVFSIDRDGKFNRKSNVYIKLNENNRWNYLSLNLLSEDIVIWEVIVSLDNADINISRGSDTLLKNKIENLKNTLILSLETNLYSSRDERLTSAATKKIIFYNDPFTSRSNLDSFHESWEESFSNFSQIQGAGWEGWNKSLLELASGKSVGESTKGYADFSLINLWDPVVSLRKIQKWFLSEPDINKHFDATIGKRISGSQDIEDYRVFDYNADDKQDILLVKSDGYIELLENKYIDTDFLWKGNLVYAADMWAADLLTTWDFTWDGYEDIFFLNNKWKPYLFNNYVKDFVRIPLDEVFALNGKIVQVKSYDMDNDTNDDIVTLDDSGQIHIFYGWGWDQSPSFTKLKVWDWYGIELNSDAISWWAAVYFDGVPQIDTDGSRTDIIESNEQYFASISENLALNPESSALDRSLLDRLIFTQVPYTQTDNTLSDQEAFVDGLEAGIPTTNNESDNANVEWARDALTNFINDNAAYIDYSDYTPNNRNTDTTFLRSEYGETLWLKIEKTFTDINQWLLQTGDIISVEVKLTNTSGWILRNIAYVDSLPKNFSLHSESIEVIGLDNKKIISGPWSYDILLDDFSLNAWSDVTLKYDIKTPPIRYGFLEVGDYERWKVWEDNYWDILLKDSEKNCWDEATLYTSVSERWYTKAGIAPQCDTDKLELPGNLSDNATDENNNGIPDYIDALTNWSPDTIQNYMQWLFDEFNQDADSDGIPDREDSSPDIDQNDESIIGSLENFNNNIDELTSEIDHIIEWFGCWFGGWGCIATPLNWAPLAPGSDPVLFGKPIWDGLRVDEGLPIFSSLTWLQIPATPTSPPVCVPSVWPVSKAWFVPGPQCGPESAGWKLGTWAPTNTVRIFATPTLTGWFWLAVCFGWPAIAAGYSNPPGVSPIAPGWNCIVAAVPIIACGQEDSWDPASLGYPSYVSWALWTSTSNTWSGANSDGSYWVINGNCEPWQSHGNTSSQTLDSSAVRWYLDYRNGRAPYSDQLEQRLVQALSTVARDGWNYRFSWGPVMDFAGWWDGDTSVDVEFDLDAATDGDFSDVVKVELDRVSPFPNFLMDWVTRQMEEVVNKLTDLPKIFVILPDMSGIFEFGWSDFSDDLQESFEEWKEQRKETVSAYDEQIKRLRNQKKWLDCGWEESLSCRVIDAKISRLNWARDLGQWETISWIRSVYEFLWNVPLVAIEPETIEVNIPWITPTQIDATRADWENTLDEWKAEVERAKESWTGWRSCDYIDPNEEDPSEIQFQREQKAECEDINDFNQKVFVDANNLISSLERNIAILDDYKRFPEKLNQLITIKQTRLEQILCNVDAISGMLSWWISFNWERFKAWVELYVLIKAILKSWQLVIDVFIDYEAECHECKNERQDLIGGTFQLISAVVPKPPIIQFPKWPDIIMDLHNIRAGLVIYLPDFSINPRPIVLPTLPALRLPDVPNANLSLPALPLLPTFTIPELPELPTLPTVELPNLPPPPRIPKLFGAVEWVLNILKLVTKAMCILKTSPFVPEWRAWDQIAYITERSWYLSTDFIDLSFPQFSYPFVDAIKVTSYVNLEFETEFITEAVRNIAAPLDTFTNDIVNMFNINIADINIEALTPSDLNIDVNSDGTIDTEGLRIQPGLESFNNTEWFIYTLVMLSANRMQDMLTYIDNNKDITLSNREFISYVSENLASESITSDPRTDRLRNLWQQVGDMTYSKEDKLIESLHQTKNAKFKALTDILNTEKERNDELKEQIKSLGNPLTITQVSSHGDTNLEAYNERLSGYNIWLMESAVELVNGWGDAEISDIESDGESLKTRITDGLTAFEETTLSPHLNLLADHTPGHTGSSTNSCSAEGSNGYSYTYEWIYILQDNHNYKLFDYTDELGGDERTHPIDVDSDGDNDLLYMVDNQLYLKENLHRTSNTTHVSSPALSLSVNDNMFFNGDSFLEALNGLTEISVGNGFINAEFDTPTSDVHNFSVEFYNRVDAAINQNNDSYLPEDTKKYVVDGFVNIDENTLKARRDNIIMRQNLWYIDYAGKLPWVRLTTPELRNIKDDLQDNNIVNLSSSTRLYAGNSPFFVRYTPLWSDEVSEVNVTKHSNIVFGQNVEIVGITWDAYVTTGQMQTIIWPRILTHRWKPLFAGTKLEVESWIENLTEASHLDIVYYDGSEREIYFRDTYGYEIYDLWERQTDTHIIRIETPNDFYYAKAYSFDTGIVSTHSQQILFAPQVESDRSAPDINLAQKIRIPVYQTRKIDMTEAIYENGWTENISDIWIDFDLETDSDNDGNLFNDRDTDKINIINTLGEISIAFGPYEELFSKRIRISAEDKNWNIGSREVSFEVYAPQPEIDVFTDGTIAGTLDEELVWEPIRIYRYRWWAVEKLQEISGEDSVLSVLEWNYDFETPITSEWLVLTRDDREIATINEYTWKVDLIDPLAEMKVLSSNDPDNIVWLPKVSVLYRWAEIFDEYIQILNTVDIQILSEFTNNLSSGMYLRFVDSENYGYYKIPLGVPFNPGAVVIYRIEDSEKTPLYTLFRDGRIDTFDSRFELRYNSFEDSVVYDLYDTTIDKKVWEVLIKVDANYILR